MMKTAIVNKTICAACGVCVKTCRRGAVSIYKGCHAQIDAAKCVGCGLCAKACPAGCITLTERGDCK